MNSISTNKQDDDSMPSYAMSLIDDYIDDFNKYRNKIAMGEMSVQVSF